LDISDILWGSKFENCPIPLHWPLAYTTACARYGTLTADDALAVDGDGDGKALHVGHVDAQYLAVLSEAPNANVLAAARRHQLRTVTNNTHTRARVRPPPHTITIGSRTNKRLQYW